MNQVGILKILNKNRQPTMLEELGHYSPFQMLVMTLLSARSKDATVIPIVKKMFVEYPEPQDFVDMPLKDLEKWIYKIGFYKTKARNVKKLSEIVVQTGVPNTFAQLTALPGVGRKTANCILAYTFKIPTIAVDIHVHRISNRLGWVNTKLPEKTEEALKKIIPKKNWIDVNKILVSHGQSICSPLKPKCPICPVNKWCKYGITKLSEKV